MKIKMIVREMKIIRKKMVMKMKMKMKMKGDKEDDGDKEMTRRAPDQFREFRGGVVRPPLNLATVVKFDSARKRA